MNAARFLVLAPALALSACGGSSLPMKAVSTAPPPKSIKAQPVRPAALIPPPRPRILALPGLEGVIGASGGDLIRQFGGPRLEVWEGDARKLQFSGTACVLDVYLYPPEPGREPQATYIEARRVSDGRDIDRAACVSALRKR